MSWRRWRRTGGLIWEGETPSHFVLFILGSTKNPRQVFYPQNLMMIAGQCLVGRDLKQESLTCGDKARKSAELPSILKIRIYSSSCDPGCPLPPPPQLAQSLLYYSFRESVTVMSTGSCQALDLITRTFYPLPSPGLS